MRWTLLIVVALASVSAIGDNKTGRDISAAPSPDAVVKAKTVFLSNGGGSDLAYDTFSRAMKIWGRYQIVSSPAEADLIIEMAYQLRRRDTQTWAMRNGSGTAYDDTVNYSGGPNRHMGEISKPRLVLTIYEAKSKLPLWLTVDRCRQAHREKNREKETINSSERMVDELKMRLGGQ
jgi:hypothetical protein